MLGIPTLRCRSLECDVIEVYNVTNCRHCIVLNYDQTSCTLQIHRCMLNIDLLVRIIQNRLQHMLG